ncbi:MAG: hypothetical protein RLZZ458_3747 [Planctomycetota bacterium]
MLAPKWSLPLLFCVPFALTAGCQDSAPEPQPTEHEHEHEHAHAETLAEAITELDELHAAISKAFIAKTPDDAHDPLHDIGEVLNETVELAKAEKLPEDRLATVNTAVTALLDAYGELDKTMHGGEGKTWEEVSGPIDEAIKNLKAAAAGDAAPAPAPEAAAPAEDKPADAAPAPASDATPATEAPAEAPKSE